MLRFFASRKAKALAALFASEPQEWAHVRTLAFEPFEVRHADRGITVWIANDAYGLQAYSGPTRRPDDGSAVTGWCVIGGQPDQQAIWHAYRKWRDARPKPYRGVVRVSDAVLRPSPINTGNAI